MIYSLKRYARFFFVTVFFRRERLHLLRDAIDWFITRKFIKKSYTPQQKNNALQDAINWLMHSQDSMTDKGFGTYYITDGWTSSYPETSGYIIPTLLLADKQKYKDRVVQCADWLLQIQKPSGGWQSMYVADNRPEVVFNTGQVIRGLIAVYELTGDQKYLDACIRSCNWLCSIQEEDGSWQKHAFMNQKRVYDAYVDHPLLLVWKITGNEKYKTAAIKNLDWIVDHKQKENGWLEDCDNTIKHNDRPILHTISYTIDGLIHSGLILNDKKYIQAGKKSADQLLRIFHQKQWLNGRWDKNWNGSEYVLCTGCAQISIVWLILYQITGDVNYLSASQKMNNQLVYIQQRNYHESQNTKGALTGSFPLWGKYEPFGFPNWATKYFADALLMELKLH